MVLRLDILEAYVLDRKPRVIAKNLATITFSQPPKKRK